MALLLPGGSRASGETLANAKAQATAIAARLNALSSQVAQLSEKYDQAQISLTQVNQQVGTAQAQIAQTEAKITHIKSMLAQEAINTYVNGGNLPNLSAILTENLTEESVRQEYLNIVTNSQTDLVASYQSATQSLDQQKAALKTLQTQATTIFNQAGAAKSAAQSAMNQEKSQLNSVNATISNLVAQQEAYLAQQAAARARQIIFDAPASNLVQPPSASGGSFAPAITGGQSSIAISWAHQEIGKPYVFGGAGPNAFDCSGLTAYIFAKAGIYLPHSAAAQYGDSTHVSLSGLQPGDLVFYYSPISHVAIYIGGGLVIQALNEAAPVEISGIYWAGVPVAAGRV